MLRLLSWLGESYGGVTILGTHSLSDPFSQRTKQALRLIEQHDLKRFRRVCKQLAIVRNTKAIRSLGGYQHFIRACAVNFNEMDFRKHEAWWSRVYACLLVHEATHGLLHSRYLGHSPKLRLRIEHLCRKEERRFLQRLPIAENLSSNYIAPPLSEEDIQWYEQGWETYRRRHAWKQAVAFAAVLIWGYSLSKKWHRRRN